jgi:pyrimidine operon attenuation protein/uracil phosphoribosyltransferase
MAQQLQPKAKIMDKAAMRRALTRIAHEIVERNEGSTDVVLVGIIRRGEVLAGMLADEIEAVDGVRPKLGTLDISFYRDDVTRTIAPVLHSTNIPFDINGANIILVDDVLYTGRTVRAALDALMDYGRPRCVQLAVMVDRGHRELPIRADYVGKNVPSSHEEDVRVYIEPDDGRTAVEIWNVADEKSAAKEAGGVK